MEMFQILTLVESINTESRDIRSVYLGHIGEMHYVSTLQAEFIVRSYQTSSNNCCVNLAPYENDINNCKRKRKNSVYMKEYGQKRKAEKGISNEEREKNNQYMKNYRAKKKFQFWISKIHDVVSQELLYIFTCCDQLFYKHSLLHTSNLRKKIPDVDKYLRGKKVSTVLNGCIKNV